MRLERSKNTKQGIKYGFVNNGIAIILPFIVQMITIRILGIEYVGIKGLYSSILSVLSLAELGIGSAIVFSMYKPIADDDKETICALLLYYKKIYRWIGVAVLGIGLVVTPFLSYLIHGSYPQDINIYIVFLLYLANSVLSYWLFAYKTSLLHAYQRVDVTSKIAAGINLGMSLAQIAVLLISRNFYLYIVTVVLFTVINNLVVSHVVDKMFPEIKGKGSVPQEIVQDIKQKVAGLLIGKVCGTTRNTFDNIFISMFLGLTQAAMYSNYYYVFSMLTGFTSIILTSLVAGIGNSIVKESKEKNYQDMMRLNGIYLLISGWMAICMLCLYQPFMKLWMGDMYLFPEHIMVLFPIYFYVTKMGDIRCVYSDAAGLFWENRNRTLMEAIANIILNYILGIKYGAFGILLATIITVFVFGFLAAAYILFKHYFEDGMKRYLLQEIILGIATIFVALATYSVCTYFENFSAILNLIIRGIICIIIPMLLYYIIFARTKTYKESVKWLLSVLRK